MPVSDPTKSLEAYLAGGIVVPLMSRPRLHALPRQTRSRMVKEFEALTGVEILRNNTRPVYTDRLADLLLHVIDSPLTFAQALQKILDALGLEYDGPPVPPVDGCQTVNQALEARVTHLEWRLVESEARILSLTNTPDDSVIQALQAQIKRLETKISEVQEDSNAQWDVFLLECESTKALQKQADTIEKKVKNTSDSVNALHDKLHSTHAHRRPRWYVRCTEWWTRGRQ